MKGDMQKRARKVSWMAGQIAVERNQVSAGTAEPLEATLPREACPPSSLGACKTVTCKVVEEEEESLHQALQPILVMAQCLGMMPLHGVSAPTPSALRFCLKSVRVVYALCITLLMGMVELVAVIHMVKSIISGSKGFISSIGAATAGVMFYGNSCVALWLFLRLAVRWPLLMAAWSRAEQATWRWGRPALALRFKITTGIILILAIVEHILSIFTNIPSILYPEKHAAAVCPGDQETASQDVQQNNFLRVYCCCSHPFIFSVVRYQVWMGVIIFIASKVATFIWNYTDIFISLLSIALSETYKRLNQRMLSVNDKNLRRQEWQELREHYATLSSLTKTVDRNISGIMLLSFANNIYFICLQLLNGMSPKPNSSVDTIYYFGSFFFLLGRTVMVTMSAARVNDESRTALPVLYSCPSESYCEEVHRLQAQITSDEIALTGMRFFHITRNFMLAMTGAIVTYEVVLLQFNVALLHKPNEPTTTVPPH